MDFLTKRLQLREIEWDDLNFVHRLHSAPEVDEFNTLGIPTNIEDTKEVIRPYIDFDKTTIRKAYSWIVVVGNSSEPVGLSGMLLSADKFKLGEIYYKFLPKYWGKGYATEVCRLLIDIGFRHFNLHKVEAGVATGNLASIRVLEKCGMLREGLRRKVLPIRGEWVDNYHYAIVEDDPR